MDAICSCSEMKPSYQQRMTALRGTLSKNSNPAYCSFYSLQDRVEESTSNLLSPQRSFLFFYCCMFHGPIWTKRLSGFAIRDIKMSRTNALVSLTKDIIRFMLCYFFFFALRLGHWPKQEILSFQCQSTQSCSESLWKFLCFVSHWGLL